MNSEAYNLTSMAIKENEKDETLFSHMNLKPMTPEQETQREKLHPAEGAPVGDWVMYAMALEQMGLTGEARAVWRKLSAERPDDPKLRQLAGQ